MRSEQFLGMVAEASPLTPSGRTAWGLLNKLMGFKPPIAAPKPPITGLKQAGLIPLGEANP